MALEQNSSPNLVGRLQERYKILAKLGSGGMADVFLAVQLGEENFQRLVVIKRIHAFWTNRDNALRMFIDEARTIASLNHPHIVKIYDLSRLDKDICIAMEYVNGENLSYILQSLKQADQRIPLPVLCTLIAQASEALHHAHTARTPDGKNLQLIHRDIGLSNLMIDANGYIKIIDFGIAKTATQNEMTSPGMLKGKFSYLAPDHFKHKDIDSRVDLYALGLVFYEMLTLKKAYNFGPDVSVARVIQELLETDLAAPSTLDEQVPGWIDELVLKAVDKDRDLRYQTGKDFAADIRACAERIGGLATFGEVADWFQEAFRLRIAKRREFERRAMQRAKHISEKGESDTANLPTTDITASINEISDVSMTSATQTTGFHVNPYIFVVLIFLLFVSGAWLWSVIFEKEPGDENQPVPPTAMLASRPENLLVRSVPAGAEVVINDRVSGVTQPKGAAFKLEPGENHLVMLRKKGYQVYKVNVMGLSSGQQIIDVTLNADLPPAQTSTSQAEKTLPSITKRSSAPSPKPSAQKKSHSTDSSKSSKPGAASKKHASIKLQKSPQETNPSKHPGNLSTKPQPPPIQNQKVHTPSPDPVPLIEEDLDLLPVRPNLDNQPDQNRPKSSLPILEEEK